jgi:hypothetical protein
MCGYGGYLDIVCLLLDHGTDLDNVDMDGDAPEILARNRDHADMVILLQGERLPHVFERDVIASLLACIWRGQLLPVELREKLGQTLVRLLQAILLTKGRSRLLNHTVPPRENTPRQGPKSQREASYSQSLRSSHCSSKGKHSSSKSKSQKDD